MLSGRSRLFSAAFVAAASWGTMASADGAKPDKLECIAADTDGQSLRMAGKLLGARKRLAVCASAVCPSIVRDDCVQRITEIEAAQPTVVFTATNGYGRSLVAVRVTVDGAPLTDRLDGRPLRVDPGEHEFAFEALGRMHRQGYARPPRRRAERAARGRAPHRVRRRRGVARPRGACGAVRERPRRVSAGVPAARVADCAGPGRAAGRHPRRRSRSTRPRSSIRTRGRPRSQPRASA